MFDIFTIFCVFFTLYFLGAVAFATYVDLQDEPTSPRWPYIKKFARKFSKNFMYSLP